MSNSETRPLSGLWALADEAGSSAIDPARANSAA